jgi:hypothetical protein
MEAAIDLSVDKIIHFLILGQLSSCCFYFFIIPPM